MEMGIVKKQGWWARDIANKLLDNMVWVMFLFSLFILGMLEPGMFSPNILINIIRQASVLGVLAVGVSFHCQQLKPPNTLKRDKIMIRERD